MAIIRTLGDLKKHIQSLPDDLPFYIGYSEYVESGTVEATAVGCGEDRVYQIIGSIDDVETNNE